MNCPPCNHDCRESRDCPNSTDDEGPGLLVSPSFYIGAFLSICAWSAIAAGVIAYFN